MAATICLIQKVQLIKEKNRKKRGVVEIEKFAICANEEGR